MCRAFLCIEISTFVPMYINPNPTVTRPTRRISLIQDELAPPDDDTNFKFPSNTTSSSRWISLALTLCGLMSLPFVLAVLSVQYRGPRARGIQNISEKQQNKKSEWIQTLHDFECLQLKHSSFKPVKYEVLWRCGRMVVTWQFDQDSVCTRYYISYAIFLIEVSVLYRKG